MYLLHAAARGTFARTLADEGGMPSVLWAGPRDKGPVRFTLRVCVDPLWYEISCGLPVIAPGSAFVLDPLVKEERVWVRERGRKVVLMERGNLSAVLRDVDGARVQHPVSIDPAESLLSQIADPHRYPELSALRQEFSAWRFYHQFRTDNESPLRQPQVGVRTPVLGHDANDLAAALQTIEEIGDRTALHRALHDAFPGSMVRVEASEGRFVVRMQLPGLHRALDARELSDGTLRYLCLVAALLSPRPPRLLALNEPETSLHPDLLAPLGVLVADAAKRGQVWVTTHAVPLARAIEAASGTPPIELMKQSGETRVVNGSGGEEDEDEGG
jgi:predicted ATPase